MGSGVGIRHSMSMGEIEVGEGEEEEEEDALEDRGSLGGVKTQSQRCNHKPLPVCTKDITKLSNCTNL